MSDLSNKRKFPRVDIRKTQKVLSYKDHVNNNYVISKNISASGFSFRSDKPFEKNQLLLVSLGEDFLEDLKINKARVMKAGAHILSQVIWCKPVSQESDYFEVGCSFAEIDSISETEMEIFTQLMNEEIKNELNL